MPTLSLTRPARWLCLLAMLVLPAFACVLAPATASAEVRVAGVFTDNMVLQREVAVPLWGTAAPGQLVSVTLGENTATATADAQGNWLARLPALPAGGPHVLQVNDVAFQNVLVGDVWVLAGQSNMEMKFRSSDTYDADASSMDVEQLRLFRVDINAFDKQAHDFQPPQRDVPVKHGWIASDPTEADAERFSAVGLYFGRDLHRETGVPIGLVMVAMGGTKVEAWTPRDVMEADPTGREVIRRYEELYKPAYVSGTGDAATRARGQPQDEPGVLYNRFLHPLTPMAVRGVFWYQGEHNTGTWQDYGWNLQAFIGAMRQRFTAPAEPMPVLVMQIHPYGRPTRERDLGQSDKAALRNAQANVVNADRNMAMVVSIDLDDRGDIHPRNKRAFGERAADVALQAFYDHDGPPTHLQYAGHEAAGNRVRIRFAPPGVQLATHDGDPPAGFLIRDAECMWRRAQAQIDGETVLVWHDDVQQPAEVAYAWEDVPSVNLQTAEGAPVAPFSTTRTQPKGVVGGE